MKLIYIIIVFFIVLTPLNYIYAEANGNDDLYGLTCENYFTVDCYITDIIGLKSYDVFNFIQLNELSAFSTLFSNIRSPEKGFTYDINTSFSNQSIKVKNGVIHHPKYSVNLKYSQISSGLSFRYPLSDYVDASMSGLGFFNISEHIKHIGVATGFGYEGSTSAAPFYLYGFGEVSLANTSQATNVKYQFDMDHAGTTNKIDEYSNIQSLKSSEYYTYNYAYMLVFGYKYKGSYISVDPAIGYGNHNSLGEQSSKMSNQTIFFSTKVSTIPMVLSKWNGYPLTVTLFTQFDHFSLNYKKISDVSKKYYEGSFAHTDGYYDENNSDNSFWPAFLYRGRENKGYYINSINDIKVYTEIDFFQQLSITGMYSYSLVSGKYMSSNVSTFKLGVRFVH